MSKVRLLNIDELRIHEAVDEVQILRIMKSIKESGKFYPPVLVDLESKVVLDGHHRLWAAKRLGCKRILCYCVDYISDDGVVLRSWRPDAGVTKQDVVDMGLSDGLFPQKTTRHIYELPDGIAAASLDELLQSG